MQRKKVCCVIFHASRVGLGVGWGAGSIVPGPTDSIRDLEKQELHFGFILFLKHCNLFLESRGRLTSRKVALTGVFCLLNAFPFLSFYEIFLHWKAGMMAKLSEAELRGAFKSLFQREWKLCKTLNHSLAWILIPAGYVLPASRSHKCFGPPGWRSFLAKHSRCQPGARGPLAWEDQAPRSAPTKSVSPTQACRLCTALRDCPGCSGRSIP